MKNSRYNEVLCDHIKNTELRRVRIKTDPNTKNPLSFGHGYEGYILEEEDGGVLTIMVPDFGDDNIFKVQPGEYDHVEHDDYTLDYLKQLSMCYISCNNEQEEQIELTNLDEIQSIDELETYLKAKNVSEDDIINIFKDFFKL